MKLLLDANLSWRLTTALAASFGDCAHVDYIGINIPAKDIEIWEFAEKEIIFREIHPKFIIFVL